MDAGHGPISYRLLVDDVERAKRLHRGRGRDWVDILEDPLCSVVGVVVGVVFAMSGDGWMPRTIGALIALLMLGRLGMQLALLVLFVLVARMLRTGQRTAALRGGILTVSGDRFSWKLPLARIPRVIEDGRLLLVYRDRRRFVAIPKSSPELCALCAAVAGAPRPRGRRG